MSMIYGKRVRLRGAERSDLEKFVEWINDPEVTSMDVSLAHGMTADV